MSSNLYDSLWVKKTASAEEIKKAYRKQAMKYHPDRNKWDKTAEKKIKEINEAYSVLSDSSKRKQYDTFGSTWWNPFGWGWWPWWGWWSSWRDFTPAHCWCFRAKLLWKRSAGR